MNKTTPQISTLSAIEQFLAQWLFFSFSDKLKFGIKVSLSLMLAYMIPMAMGWSQPNTAAITVMLIATTGVVGESVMKGAIRVIGTVIGATIGLTLIALFPQDRMTYLLVVSLLVVLITYLYNAYQGDSTVFMLSAMMIMMVFDGGNVDNVFLYGVDRTFMTIFGIVVYTLVGLFLWPVKESDTTIDDAQTLTTLQKKLFTQTINSESKDEGLLSEITTTEQKFLSSHLKASSASLDMSLHPGLWDSITHNYKALSSLLNLLSTHAQEKDPLKYTIYISDYAAITEEIEQLFKRCEQAWSNESRITLPETRELTYIQDEENTLTHLQKSALVTHANIIKNIHTTLRTLADRLNQRNGHESIVKEERQVTSTPRFIWLDPEYLRGIVQIFLIFWFGVGMWIYFNPPGGFLVVTLATLLSLLTSFSPLKPSVLTILFTIGFIFALLMYILVLPNLVYGWQLALFIFFYTFIAFYLINPKISIFFLLGMFTLGIGNEMHYNFAIFLTTLLVFYLFLAILMLFYYLPFSTKPEHLFLRMIKRLYRHVSALLESSHKERSWLQKKIDTYHLLHMQRTANKLTLWASQVDVTLFAPNTKEQLMAFANTSNLLATHVGYLVQFESSMKPNLLLDRIKTEYSEQVLSHISVHIAELNAEELTTTFEKGETIMEQIELLIEHTKKTVDPDAYKEEEITAFYIDIDLRHSVWNALKKCHNTFYRLDINALQRNRF